MLGTNAALGRHFPLSVPLVLASVEKRYGVGLTNPWQMAYTTIMLSASLYITLRQDIEAEFEARKRTLDEERRKAIEALNEAWPKMGGSESDLTNVVTEAASFSPVEPQADERTREVTSKRNGSPSERTVPSSVIREEVREALSDTETDIITQTDIKKRVLEKYPDAKIGSLRPAISRSLSQLTEQGELELVGRGVTRNEPHRYRKVMKERTAPIEGLEGELKAGLLGP